MQNNSVISIKRGLQLPQLSRNSYWPHGQLSGSHSLTVSQLSVCHYLTSQSSLTQNTTYTSYMTHFVNALPEFRNSGISEVSSFPVMTIAIGTALPCPSGVASRVAVDLRRDLGRGPEAV